MSEVQLNMGSKDAVKSSWSKNGKLTTGKSQTQKCQAEFDVAGDFTVEFDITALGPGNVVGGFQQFIQKAEATITFATEGNFVSRRVTIAPGMTLQGVAEHVTVVMEDDSIQLLSGSGIGSDYEVTVLIAKGTRGSTGQPPYLMGSFPGDHITIPDGLPVVHVSTAAKGVAIAVPEDAGINCVFVSMAAGSFTASPPNLIPIPEGSAYVRQRGDLGVNLDLMDYDPRTHEWVPLAAGCTTLEVINNFGGIGGPTVAFTVIWGIDG